jgi:hypothetical protein
MRGFWAGLLARRAATRFLIGACATALVVCGARSTFGTVFQTIDVPGSPSTYIAGISGNLVVGSDEFNARGFVYNDQTGTFTYYSDPQEATSGNFASYGTRALGVSGSEVVGVYYDSSGITHGFLYNGSSYTTLDDPIANKTTPYQGTVASGVSGNTVVGQGNVPTGFAGYVYNGTSFTTLDYPGAVNTFVQGISGNLIFGNCSSFPSIPPEGFIYNGSTFTAIVDPLALAAGAEGQTTITGMSGQDIVGYYTTDNGDTDHGFLYNGSTFTTINDPLAPNYTQIFGISGNTIVGEYNNGGPNGFIATIPEPSSLLMMAVGGFGIGGIVMRKRRHPKVGPDDKNRGGDGAVVRSPALEPRRGRNILDS